MKQRSRRRPSGRVRWRSTWPRPPHAKPLMTASSADATERLSRARWNISSARIVAVRAPDWSSENGRCGGESSMSERTEKAILAGGCFWGMQDLIRKRPGVVSTRVGYTGGDVANATYRNHGTHAEAIEITFDPDQTSYRDLLEFFFQIHDPTTLQPPGQRRGHELPLGHLLRRRRAASGRRGHHRRRRSIGSLAGQGRHRSRSGRDRSGRPNPSTRTTWSTIPTATRATSRARAGCCPDEATPSQ